VELVVSNLHELKRRDVTLPRIKIYAEEAGDTRREAEPADQAEFDAALKRALDE
jgi:hypothetical protein